MISSNTELDTRLKPVYSYLVEYFNLFGYAPSLREIAANCHISVTTATHYLDRLQTQGLIMRADARARSIVLRKPNG